MFNISKQFLKAPWKTKEKLMKNGNFYAKSTLVFGVTQKQMSVDTVKEFTYYHRICSVLTLYSYIILLRITMSIM